MNTKKLAKGQRGLLIRGLGDQIWFRQYTDNGEFIDYTISHHDCEIEIVDDSAELISNENGDYLDYTDEVLGIKR